VIVGLHFALAIFVRGPHKLYGAKMASDGYLSYSIVACHIITKPPAPSPFLNKRDFMFQGSLAATLRLRPSFLENQNMFIPDPWLYCSLA
jgi:hypothetical protein